MQTDPVGYEDQMNLYAYVHNDPLNFVDRTGESAVSLVGTIFTADAVTPDPSDVAVVPKVVGYAAAFAVAGIVDYAVDLMSENSDDPPEEKPKQQKEKDVPDRSKPNDVVEGKRRTREYDNEGKPKRDYDKPHQGDETDHVHEWEGGKREHPGRPYSPLPTPPSGISGRLNVRR